MTSSTPVVYSRLFLPHPLPASHVAAVLTRLASEQDGQPVVLETRADDSGIQQLIGCSASFTHALRRMLHDLIPGALMVGLGSYARPPMTAAGRITVKPPALPLATHNVDEVLRAVYSALARRHPRGEAVCLQLVLGPGFGPRLTPPQLPDPTASVWRTLTNGQRTAPAELRNRVKGRDEHHILQCVLRIGVTAATADKRQRLVGELVSALSITASAGVKLQLLREDPNRLNMLPLTRRGTLSLSVPELVALTSWPVGETPLPGMPPAHPKMLRADASVSTTDFAFAESLVPGDDRQFGLATKDFLTHGFALGPTLSGKTHFLRLLACPFIEQDRAVFFLDPKAQHAPLLELIPEARWKDVVVIDGTENTLGFNPLDATGRDPDVVADSALHVFKGVLDADAGPRTLDLFSAALRTLTRTGTKARPHTVLDIPRLWTDAAFRRDLVAQVQDDVALAGHWAWFESLKPAAQMSVIASPLNKLRRLLLSPAAMRVLGNPRPGFRLQDIFRENAIVVLAVSEGLVGPETSTLINSFAVAAVWQAVQERASEKEPEKRPGLVVVDEADLYVHLNVSLESALARSRSLGVSWWLATQGWEMLPKALRAAIKTNAKTKLVWRLENDDDARTFAKLAPELTADDLMALGQYEVYARLVSGGITTGWALMKILPSPPAASDPAEVLKASLTAHQLPQLEEPVGDLTAPRPVPPSSPAEASSAPVGRVRRKKP